MLLRRILTAAPARCRLLPRFCSYSSSSPKLVCYTNALVNFNDEKNTLSCSFTLQDDVLGECSRTVDTVATNSVLKFQKKIADLLNRARRNKVSRALKKGNYSLTTVKDISVAVLDTDGQPLSEEISVEVGFRNDYILCIGEAFLRIVRNPPTVIHVDLPKLILLDCPVFVSFQPVHCEAKDCEVEWAVWPKKTLIAPYSQGNWNLVQRGRFAVFKAAFFLDRWVRVRVVPRNAEGTQHGLEVMKVSRATIVEGPCLKSPICDRHARTRKVCDMRTLRIVSYNLLADFYANSIYSRDYLFPYCPPKFLDFQYRQQLILWELMGYNADIICLQEVDKTFFETVLQPAFCDDSEFESRFLPKLDLRREGIAIIYRRSKLEFVRDCSLPSVSQALAASGLFESVIEDIAKAKAFEWKWAERNQCLLALLFRSVEDPLSFLCAATTHLYSFPTASNIRLLQMAVCLRHLESTQAAVTAEHEGARCGVLLSGDFNSLPSSGAVRLATEGRLQDSPLDWYSNGIEEYFGSPDLRHALNLQSIYNDDAVGYTNFTATFHGTLDYIFYDKQNFDYMRCVPLPSFEQLTELTALPNEYFPSDHIALIGEVAWKEREKE